MQYELVINSTPAQVVLALLKEKKLIEIHQEDDDSSFNVGDVYLGKIRKIVPSLNAAFVDVGYEKDAFLHYHDLGPRFKSMNKYVQNNMKPDPQRHLQSCVDIESQKNANVEF